MKIIGVIFLILSIIIILTIGYYTIKDVDLQKQLCKNLNGTIIMPSIEDKEYDNCLLKNGTKINTYKINLTGV